MLFWLTGEKSNAEIAAILGTTTATVGKHLERIYPKLGVENRTAAANFREDMNANGLINSSAIALVQCKSGTAVP